MKDKDRRFNRITGGTTATVPSERGFGQGRQEARRGGNRRRNALTVDWREESRVVARGYYVSTVGRDEATVRKYIRNQEKEDERLEQLKLWS